MDGYICLKPVKLFGVQYNPNDFIPLDVVLPSRVSALIRNGTIAQVSEQNNTPDMIVSDLEGTVEELAVSVPIHAENGVMELVTPYSEVQQVFEIMQLSAKEAPDVIKTVESENILIILDACDSRKTITDAVRARVKQLKEETSEDNAKEPNKSNESLDGDA